MDTDLPPYLKRIRTPVQRSRRDLSRQAHTPVQHFSSSEQVSVKQQQLTLVVQPILKSTNGQPDSSDVIIDDISVSGASFTDIIT
ncbi:hypothetical protein GN958_ATG01970 [Phytophthora infestans]|uniref:Uncharacterized protein n=1 Tax=Phytophthora infestans TaxID=4787 RepID=A0A8S9VBT7_PHYIN|nr:hypothetical protein GN958_ATG01970 [Phytophthora infestans]